MKAKIATAISLALGTAAALAVATTQAEQTSGFNIAPMLEYQMFDMDRNLDDPLKGALRLGYKTNSPWGLELGVSSGSADGIGNNAKADVLTYGLDILYHFAESDGVTPYLLIGGGKDTYSYNNLDLENDMVNVGGGLKVAISDIISFRPEFRVMNDLENELTDYVVGVGFNFLLGGQRATPKAKPVAPIAVAEGDADKDGVVDSKDACPKTSMGAKVDGKGCYIIIEDIKEIQLKVNFENNSFVVSPDSYNQIDDVAKFMKEYPLTKVMLEGHTDDVGSDKFNKTLSEKRAAAVAKLLADNFGIDASRISSAGYGESKPLVPNNSADNRATNRRVTALVSATTQEILK